MTIIDLIIIAIALSMDTFSFSLSISLLTNSIKKQTLLIFLVGLFHFSFPFIGGFLGQNLIKIISISSNKLLGFIFLFLFLKLYYDLKQNKNESLKLTIPNIIFFAILVSIDSLITGIGLENIIKTSCLPSIIFSIISSFFTFLGLIIGKYAQKELGTKANNIGLLLLLLLSFVHLFK
jgi:manganese efflux pump family protein